MNKIQVHLKSFHSELAKNTLVAIQRSVNYIDNLSQCVHTEKTFKKRYTVIRSPHVHKKSREQFQLTEYHVILSIQAENINALLLLLQSGSFYGVQLKTSVKTSSFFCPLNKK